MNAESSFADTDLPAPFHIRLLPIRLRFARSHAFRQKYAARVTRNTSRTSFLNLNLKDEFQIPNYELKIWRVYRFLSIIYH